MTSDEKEKEVCSVFSGKEGAGGTMVKSSAVPCQNISRTTENVLPTKILSLSTFTEISGAEKHMAAKKKRNKKLEKKTKKGLLVKKVFKKPGIFLIILFHLCQFLKKLLFFSREFFWCS